MRSGRRCAEGEGSTDLGGGGRAPIDGINYTSLSRNLGITRFKAERYVRALERAFLLRQAFPAGANVLREPKVFMEPPYRPTRRSSTPFAAFLCQVMQAWSRTRLWANCLPASSSDTQHLSVDEVLAIHQGLIGRSWWLGGRA